MPDFDPSDAGSWERKFTLIRRVVPRGRDPLEPLSTVWAHLVEHHGEGPIEDGPALDRRIYLKARKYWERESEKQRRLGTGDPSSISGAVAAADRLPDAELAGREERERLRSAAGYSLLDRYYGLECPRESADALAEELGISVSALRKRIHRIKQEIDHLLDTTKGWAC